MRRTLDDYLWSVEIPTRITDNGGDHLNHAVFFAIFESALNIFLDEHGFSPIDDSYARLVRVAQTEYLAVTQGWPNPVTVGIGCRKLGSSSVDLEFAMFQYSDQATAVGNSVHIFVERETGKPCAEAINQNLRSVFQRMLDIKPLAAKI